MGEWVSGRVGEVGGRVGEWASGRVGEWASGRGDEGAKGREGRGPTVPQWKRGPFRIQNSEFLNGEFSPRGPEGGGERGSSPEPIGAPPRGRVENPVSSGFLEGSGRFRPRQGQERTDITGHPSTFGAFGTISGTGEGPYGGTGKGGEETFDLFRTGPPRGILVRGQFFPPGGPRLTWRRKVPEEPKAPPCTLLLPTQPTSQSHTLLTFCSHALLAFPSLLLPLSVFLFVGSSVLPFLSRYSILTN